MTPYNVGPARADIRRGDIRERLIVTTTRRVGIIGGVRIPFCRNNTAYADIGNFGMSVKVLGSLVERFGLHGVELGEVAMGAVIKHASDWNIAREATLSSGLAPTTPGITTARACGTSLDNAILIGNKIAMGQIEAGIAGGSDTTSDVPIVYTRALQQRLLKVNRAKDAKSKAEAAIKGFSFGELRPSFPGVAEPRTSKSMGEHCELMARQWKISREDQDVLALESHRKLGAAYARGFFEQLVVPPASSPSSQPSPPRTTRSQPVSGRPIAARSSGLSFAMVARASRAICTWTSLDW